MWLSLGWLLHERVVEFWRLGLVWSVLVLCLSCLWERKESKREEGRGRDACLVFFWHEGGATFIFPLFFSYLFSHSLSLSVDDGFGGGAYNGIREPRHLYNYCLLI